MVIWAKPVDLSELPDHHRGARGCLFLHPYFHRGTVPWPSYRLPDPCGLDFPPHPSAIPRLLCPSSMLRLCCKEAAQCCPTPGQMGITGSARGRWWFTPQWVTLCGPSSTSLTSWALWIHLPPNNFLADHPESSRRWEGPRPGASSPHICSASQEPYALAVSPLTYVSSFCPLCGSLHQHFSSVLKHFPTLHKNFSLPLFPLQLLPRPSLPCDSHP